jgi:hypothetical protein
MLKINFGLVPFLAENNFEVEKSKREKPQNTGKQCCVVFSRKH